MNVSSFLLTLGLAAGWGGRPLGKLRHEASQGHSLAKSTAECEDLLLVRHSTLLRVPAFGAVSPRAAGVQLHPQHPDG